MTTPENDEDLKRAQLILEKMLAQTIAGKLEWVAREHREFSYEVDLPGGNVEVGTADDDGAGPYDFKIYGPKPKYGLVFEMTSRREPPAGPQVAQLWNMVNRKVRGLDKVLDDLLKDLD